MTWWYVNRAAGLVAWALLTGSIVIGLLTSTRIFGRVVRPVWLTDLHRGLSALAVAFTAVHVAGAVGDNYLHFGTAEVLVPFTSSWRPLAIAWGVVSLYLLVAVEASALARRHLPRGLWRRLHYLSFPLFVSATAHAITAGTEMGATLGIAAASVATAIIAGLTVLRTGSEMAKHRPTPPPTHSGRPPEDALV